MRQFHFLTIVSTTGRLHVLPRRELLLRCIGFVVISALLVIADALWANRISAQIDAPTMLDKRLGVRTVVSGLRQPTSLAFLGHDDMLFLQKNTGQVWRILNGSLQATPVLDLAVNNLGSRGLMGIAAHPSFPANPSIYLYWTESITGQDTNIVDGTTLLGNRVDRFVWNGSMLIFDSNVIKLRSLEHIRPSPGLNGGVIAFGPDQKLYINMGDVNRRGQLQNLRCGPPWPLRSPEDCSDPIGEESGSDAVDARLTGVILRLNDDGSTPNDNPFYAAGMAIGGEVGTNIQKVFAYGFRNSFGMAFDPVSGDLWATENGDDAFDELNRVEPGMNSGWIQLLGPAERISQFKTIESTFGDIPSIFGDNRWLPSNIADTPEEALARLFMLPGAHYSDPEFSWKWAVPPAAIGFAGRGLGPHFQNDLFMGGAFTDLQGGHLFHFNFIGQGRSRKIKFEDQRLKDLVADNTSKYDVTESESLLIGTNFGIVTDIESGPSGNLFVVSFTRGAIYEIYSRR